MRFGIFSDVHSNLEALEVVMAAMEREKVNRLICLGDTVGYGADPAQCSEIIRRVSHVTVAGNHDAAICGRMDLSFYGGVARNALLAQRDAVSSETLAWLRGLAYEYWESANTEYSEIVMSFSHGLPPLSKNFEYLLNVNQAYQMLPDFEDLPLVAFLGHSHLPMEFELTANEVFAVGSGQISFREGSKYLVSVGSVGQPRDKDPRAAFAIFDSQEMIYTPKRVEYDIARAARKILDKGGDRSLAMRLFYGI